NLTLWNNSLFVPQCTRIRTAAPSLFSACGHLHGPRAQGTCRLVPLQPWCDLGKSQHHHGIALGAEQLVQPFDDAAVLPVVAALTENGFMSTRPGRRRGAILQVALDPLPPKFSSRCRYNRHPAPKFFLQTG